jgi:UDP-N-acetylmuramoyl-L-alanyl-D-glutamate--2,6-diaminopimelate ligase
MIRKVKNLAHLMLAILANLLYGFPGRKLRVIGVTGTDGKTTTTSLIYHILKTSGKKVSTITTIGANLDNQTITTGLHVTTPSPFQIQRFLKKAADAGHEFVILETSSHGIDQNRIWGIAYEIGVITNITHEHLDYHSSFNEYVETKFKFLSSVKTAVINIDDEIISKFVRRLKNIVITYSLNNELADYNIPKFPFSTKLFGEFNQYNTLAALAACKSLSLTDEEIRQGISTFEAPPGRQEMAYDGEFKVMVDFAHTPNSIENVLREAKKTKPNRLVHLFGAPGRRDISKRPLMGQASSRYADIIVVTADDPRDESVSKIIEQIKSGINNNFIPNENLFEFEDRRKALEFVLLELAKPNDFIILTGKGHEPTLALADRELPWVETKIVKEILKK